MLSWKHKGVLAIAAAATFAASAPRDADAFIFRWWRDRCAARQTARVAYFAPTACGTCNTCQPACQPACQQQVCSYQPQTCFRTVTQQVPVTVYRPVTTVDPCTGCPSTTMQACTTMTTQVQRVPVTTFRQVCQMVPAQPTCSTCPTTVGMPVVNAQLRRCPLRRVLSNSNSRRRCPSPLLRRDARVAKRRKPRYRCISNSSRRSISNNRKRISSRSSTSSKCRSRRPASRLRT